MSAFTIFNHSSESMREITDESIDLIIAGPPYNIGTQYDTFSDTRAFKDYVTFVDKVVGECHRVLKKNGRMIVEASDSARMGDLYVQLAGLIQSRCLRKGFILETRHINFAHTEKMVELPEDARWDAQYKTTKNAHSNAHQFLVFTKKRLSKGKQEGKIFYFNYQETKIHPCPFPPQTYKTLLDLYFTKGNVLDPFMGTAVLGVEVLKRGGSFYGYELVNSYYATAQKNLSAVKEK